MRVGFLEAGERGDAHEVIEVLERTRYGIVGRFEGRGRNHSVLYPERPEYPREIVSQGDAVNVLILEIDADRRRLSLSLKRVAEGDAPRPRADGADSLHAAPPDSARLRLPRPR